MLIFLAESKRVQTGLLHENTWCLLTPAYTNLHLLQKRAKNPTHEEKWQKSNILILTTLSVALPGLDRKWLFVRILLSCWRVCPQQTFIPACKQSKEGTNWWSEKLLRPMLATPLWFCYIPAASEVLLTRWWSWQPVFSAGHGDPDLLKGYCHQREKKKMSELG